MAKARDATLILAALWFSFLAWTFLGTYRADVEAGRFEYWRQSATFFRVDRQGGEPAWWHPGQGWVSMKAPG